MFVNKVGDPEPRKALVGCRGDVITAHVFYMKEIKK